MGAHHGVSFSRACLPICYHTRVISLYSVFHDLCDTIIHNLLPVFWTESPVVGGLERRHHVLQLHHPLKQ
jgi:hypothetical protein